MVAATSLLIFVVQERWLPMPVNLDGALGECHWFQDLASGEQAF
jgi:hypothetical protein